jgi:hypothetical protein
MRLFKNIINIIKFAPDKNNTIIKYYHISNKLLIPFLLPSFILDNDYTVKKYFDFINITNLGFHSFVSFSNIITDYYKKIPFINQNYLRLINLKGHSFLVLFFSYNLYLKHYDAAKFNKRRLSKTITLLE